MVTTWSGGPRRESGWHQRLHAEHNVNKYEHRVNNARGTVSDRKCWRFVAIASCCLRIGIVSGVAYGAITTDAHT